MSGILSAFIGRVAGVVTDAYFNLVTLLLPGNGTNGAQNNTFLDSSTNNFTITRNGNTTQGTFSPFSQTGWSNYFDGTGDYLTWPSGSSVAFGTGDFTVECWVYPLAAGNTIQGGFYFVDARNASQTSAWAFTTNVDDSVGNAYRMDWFNGSTSTFSTGYLTQNAWNHCVYTRSGTSGAMFLNGTRVASFTDSNNYSVSPTISYIGSRFSNNYQLNGYMSNLRIVKGTAVYNPSNLSITVPTVPLGATSGGQTPPTGTQTSLLTCQSNRFVDNGTANSGSGFALTVNGTPSVQAFSPFAPTAAYSAATVGGSGYFDGTGDSLSVATNAALTVTGNVDACFEAWIYPTATPGSNSTILQKSGISGSVYSNYELAFSTGRAVVLFGGSSGSPGSVVFTLTGATGMPLNAWSHVVGTKRYVGGGSVNEYRVFVNGKLDGFTTNANISDGNAQAFTVGSLPGATAFTGYIAGARVFNTAIPSDYQTTNTTVGTQIFTPPTAPATAGTSSILLNYTNAGITDATAKNVLETVGNAQISTTQSKFGGSSMYFDGTGDYLPIPSSENLGFGTGDFTIEGWLYLNATSSFSTIISNRNDAFDTTTGRYSVAVRNSAFEFYANGAQIISSGTISTSTWTHFAVTRASGSARLFLNGTQVGSTTSFTTSLATRITTIGANNAGGEAINAYIDDFRITKGYARYTANFTAPTAAFALQ